jgi:hypothetical protein
MPNAVETSKVLVKAHIKLDVVTKDKLRKFSFDLEKGTKDDVETWSIVFSLLDRATPQDDFSEVVSIDVDLDLKKVAVEDVEATAEGFNKRQLDFLVTTVAADAKKLKEGKIKETRMARTMQDLIAARNA